MALGFYNISSQKEHNFEEDFHTIFKTVAYYISIPNKRNQTFLHISFSSQMKD